jgi:glycosyltransferase involved in cell wall biosynthesis
MIIGIWSKYVLGMTWVADFFDDPRRGFFNASSRKLPMWRVIVERALLSLYRHFLKGADLVTCNAPDVETGLARVLSGEFRVDTRKLIAVPCGVDEEYIAACLRDPRLNEQASEILTVNGLKNRRYIYMVGHINSDVSGVDTLLQSVAALKNHSLEYHLLLAGICKPNQLVWLNSTIRQMNLSLHVHYLGEINQPLSYILIERAAVCVCSYKTKDREDYQTAYPIKLLEYLTVGVPTITVETPITRLIVSDFESGILVPSSSEREITESVKSLALSRARGPRASTLRQKLPSSSCIEAPLHWWEGLGEGVDQSSFSPPPNLPHRGGRTECRLSHGCTRVPLTYRWNTINESLRISLSRVLPKIPGQLS